MNARLDAHQLLEGEARALLTRLALVRSFALYETMVPAAAISFEAQTAIERYLMLGRRALRQLVDRYIRWLHSSKGRSASPAEAQQRFTRLRLQFNVVLSQFDIFASVVTQRSEYGTGVWLSGLDVVAADGLALPGGYYDAPPVICYLDRAHGAAIRRARTRLPGGGENPVAIVRVPRERMVGSGIASSLFHEVGHQGAALLNLVASLRPLVRGLQEGSSVERLAWHCFERWLSEVLADLWAVGRLGITATHGLMGVVSLPRYFVFRLNLSDPHPPPWFRVKLSCLMGEALYPDAQWAALAGVWESFYPLTGPDTAQHHLFTALEATMPDFVSLILNHRPAALRGKSLRQILSLAPVQPAYLRACYQRWRFDSRPMHAAAPSLAFAVLGQARADGVITPEAESHMLSDLLSFWALHSTLDRSAICARSSRQEGPRPAISIAQ